MIACCKLNQVIAPTITASLDVASHLQQSKIFLFTWYINIDLVRISFLIIIKRKKIKNVLHSPEVHKSLYFWLYLKAVNYLAFY